ncbi:hypothetical protein [Afifella sp. YEN Y35]|uniref:hypothetical protein n=1 Tax=Afifella sp. YEN Y35 TaxID=3388337 RepID=UPI0039E1C855|nr:hypothetical protein [Afifella sp. H1R]
MEFDLCGDPLPLMAGVQSIERDKMALPAELLTEAPPSLSPTMKNGCQMKWPLRC